MIWFLCGIFVLLVLLSLLLNSYRKLAKTEKHLEQLVLERTSEMKRAQEELLIARDTAEVASGAKSAFLASMSHEIRTPMNGIIGYSDLALKDDIPDQTRQYLNDISSCAVWLLNIVNDILDITKIEAGKIDLEYIPFNLQDIITHCHSVVLMKAEEKGIFLYCYAEPIADKMLMGDPVRLNQIIINLLSNAIKFTEVGTVKVLASIVSKDEDVVSINFEVKDSGIGMGLKQLEEVFEPFAQADDSFSRRYGGTGLGLPITKELIELMGGTLSVESILGVGSKFSFTLTFDLLDDEKVIATQEMLSDNLQTPIFNGEILICEDNKMNQQVIYDHLTRLNIQTVLVQNGKEGVDIVADRHQNREKPFDLIFMDVHMPVLDGLEAAKMIIDLGVATPIVALTANVMINDLKHYRKNGMSDILSKPFTSRELWTCLMKYLPISGVISNETLDSFIDSEQSISQLQAYFVKSNTESFKQICEALEIGNVRLAQRLAHTLKGNAEMIGAKKLQEASAAVEKALGSSKKQASIKQMHTLEVEFNKVLKNLSPESKDTVTLNISQIDENEIIAALIERLEPKLKNYDTDCIEMLPELQQVPDLEELARNVEVFNYNKALIELTKIKEKVGVAND